MLWRPILVAPQQGLRHLRCLNRGVLPQHPHLPEQLPVDRRLFGSLRPQGLWCLHFPWPLPERRHCLGAQREGERLPFPPCNVPTMLTWYICLSTASPEPQPSPAAKSARTSPPFLSARSTRPAAPVASPPAPSPARSTRPITSASPRSPSSPRVVDVSPSTRARTAPPSREPVSSGARSALALSTPVPRATPSRLIARRVLRTRPRCSSLRSARPAVRDFPYFFLLSFPSSLALFSRLLLLAALYTRNYRTVRCFGRLCYLFCLHLILAYLFCFLPPSLRCHMLFMAFDTQCLADVPC